MSIISEAQEILKKKKKKDEEIAPTTTTTYNYNSSVGRSALDDALQIMAQGQTQEDIAPVFDSVRSRMTAALPGSYKPFEYDKATEKSVSEAILDRTKVTALSYEDQKSLSTYIPMLANKRYGANNWSVLKEVQLVSSMEEGEAKEKRKKDLLKELKSIISNHNWNEWKQPLDDGWDQGDIASMLMVGVEKLFEGDTFNENDLYSLLTGEARDADFWDLTVNSAVRGYTNSRYGEESFAAMNGEANEKQYYENKLEGRELQFATDNWFERAVSGGAEMFGQQVRQWTNPDSLALGVSAVGMAALAGNAGPQALVPEEIVSVPGAFLTGIHAGSVKQNLESEAGLAYNEMLEAGVSEDTAKKIAWAVGSGNAALEAVQLDELAKAFKATKATGATKTFWKKVLGELAERGVDVAKETAQEVVQEGVTMAGVNVGSKIDTGDWEYTWGEMFDRAGETALSSALSFGFMNAPATGRNIASITADHKAQNTLTANEQSVVDKIVENRTAEAEKNGEKVSKTKIYNEVRQDMEKGYITTDEIESVLGGEKYEAYKKLIDEEASLVEQQKALYDEYKELGKKENPNLEEQSRYHELKVELTDLQKKIDASQNNPERAALKAQLDKDTYEMVKGDKLVESFFEDVRSKRQYQNDVTKYEGKAREVIQKVIDSGQADDSNRSHEFWDFAAELASNRDMDVEVASNEQILEMAKADWEAAGGKWDSKKFDGKTMDAYVNNGKIVINAKSKRAMNVLLGHEITHTLEKSGHYKSMQKILLEYAQSRGELEGRRKDRAGTHDTVFENDPKIKEKIEMEVTADLAGDYFFTDKDFIQHLLTTDKNIFQKAWDEVKYLAKMATGSEQKRLLERAKRAYEKAWRDSAKATEMKFSTYNKPSFTKEEWSIVNRRKHSEFDNPKFDLDSDKKWMYANEKGSIVFAVYSKHDAEDPTVLYGSHGAKAQRDYNYLMEFSGGGANAKRSTANRGRTALDRLLKDIERTKGNGSNDGTSPAGRKPAVGNVSLPLEESGSNGRGNLGDGAENIGQSSLTEYDKEASEFSDASFVVTFSNDYNTIRNFLKDDSAAKDGPKYSLSDSEIQTIQSIGRRSINSFTSQDIAATEKFARQYWEEMGTKSPFYRAWFGDWRENDQTLINVATKQGDTRVDHLNRDTGWTIRNSGKVHNETASHRSMMNREAVPYLPYVDEIIENAVLLDTSGIGKKKSENSLLMHYLYAVADIGSGPEVLKLTVEEMYNPGTQGTNKRAYTLQNIEKAFVASGRVQGNSPSSVTNTANAVGNVADLFALVKQYDGNFVPNAPSKIVNADGTPKVMYHGSQEQFTVFDKSKAKGIGQYGRGFYFTDSASHAGTYGNLYSVYLNIRNPLQSGMATVSRSQVRDYLEVVAENENYSIENYGTYDVDAVLDNIMGQDRTADAFKIIQDINATAIGDMVEATELFNTVNGTTFDGIVAPTETVAFYPEQIKSATDNIGTFDKSDLDIRFSLSETANNSLSLEDGPANGQDLWYKTANGGMKYNLSDIDINRNYIDYSNAKEAAEAIDKKVSELVEQGKVVPISGDSITNYENSANWEDKRAVRQLLKKILEPNLGVSVVFGDGEQGATAYLTRKGIEHSVGGPASPKKAAAFEMFSALIKNAEYVFSSENDLHSIQNFDGEVLWDTFVAVGTVDGKPYPVTFKIRSIDSDVRSQIYEVATKKETGFSHGDGNQENLTDAHPTYGTSPVSDGRVAQEEPIVKQQFPIRDSTGGQLPNEQVEYFEDAQDEKGLDVKSEDMTEQLAPVMSLSNIGDTPKQYGSWNVYAKDIMLDKSGDAPLRTDYSEELADPLPDYFAPVQDDIAPIQEESAPITENLGQVQADQSKGYQTSKINQAILNLVERVKRGLSAKNERVQLGTVSDNIAVQIQKLTGVNVQGYKVAVEARQIEHILKDHGENGQSDKSMANADDIARMEFALKNPDSIVNAGTTKAYVTNQNGKMKPAKTVLYEKQNGNGSYYVVQAVPDTNKKTLYIVTAFIGKSGYRKTEAPQSTNAVSPGATPEAESVAASNNIISGNGDVVNDDFVPYRAENETIAPMGEGYPSANESVGAAPSGFAPISHLQYKYGTIPEGEHPVRDDSLPVSTNGEDRVSRTARTVKGAGVTPDEFVDLLDQEVVKGGLSYLPVSNNGVTQEAIDYITEEGWEAARYRWSADVRRGMASAKMSAVGALLLNNAAKAGDKTAWLEILADYRLMGTRAAQATQALRILKTLAPTDTLYMAEKSVEKMVRDLHLEGEVEIDQDLMKAYTAAKTDQQRDAILTEIQKNVAKQLPSTMMEMWTALRYVNMLGNFKTQIRNIWGNVTMSLTNKIKNITATGLEALVYKASKGNFKRTKSLRVGKDLLRACKADFAEIESLALDGGKYVDAAASRLEKGIRDEKRVFKAPHFVKNERTKKIVDTILTPLEKYRQVTTKAMERGDLLFSKSAYARALAGYLKANGVKNTDLSQCDEALLDEARMYAIKEAQEVTFRDHNALTEILTSKLEERSGIAKVVNTATQGIMPFRQTPANVLLRAEEYSPLGFANALVLSLQSAAGKSNLTQKKGLVGEFAKSGQDITGAQLINSFAKSLTGTGLFLTGMALSNLGAAIGGADEDEKEEAFDKLHGKQNFSLKICGVYYTLDWLSPSAIPFFMGVNLMEQVHENGWSAETIKDALMSLTEPMLQMSMLQGLNDTLDDVRYAEIPLLQIGENALFSYAVQGMTNSLLSHLERGFEDKRYTTYVDKNSSVDTDLQKKLGKNSAKIPGWDYNQVPYINAWGEEEENPGALVNLAYNLFSPGYFSKDSTDDVAKELYRLNEVNKEERGIFPKTPEKTATFTDRQGTKYKNYDLSADEYVALAKEQGQTQRRIVEELFRSKEYKALTDEQKVKAVHKAYDYAREYAQIKVLERDSFSAKWMAGIEGKEAQTIIQRVSEQ